MAVGLMVALMCGCDRRQPPVSPAAIGPVLNTPVETLRALRRWQANKQYRLMEPYIVPESRAELIDTLMAVDRVLAANARLHQLARQRFGPGVMLWPELSSLRQSLGPFSRRIKVIDSRQDRRQAIVMLQVGNRVPLLQVR
ncbi:MAG: hypothetical protein ACE5K7_00765, partial [Phycisphaerae bacterium]